MIGDSIPSSSTKESVLNAIYSFPHSTPSESQSNEEIVEFVRLFQGLADHLALVQVPDPEESNLPDFTLLAIAIAGCDTTIPTETICKTVYKWLPAYGCAIILEFVDVNQLHVNLMFLDEWTYHSRRLGTDSNVEFATPSLKNTGYIHLGMVEKDVFLDEFATAFQNAISGAKGRIGETRSAAGGNQGHQRTPAFIKAVIIQILMTMESDDVQEVQVPYGATTDVGLHSGGRPRCTTWPLAIHALKIMLPTEESFLHILSRLHLFLLESKLLQVEHNQEFSPVQMDECHVILKAACDALIQLKYETSVPEKYHAELVALVDECHTRLENIVKQYTADNPFSAPTADELKFKQANLSPCPSPFALKESLLSNADIEKLRNANIGAISLFMEPLNRASRYHVLLDWARSAIQPQVGIDTNMAQILVLRTINEFFWKDVRLLDASSTEFDLDSADAKGLNSLIDVYQSTLKSLLDSPACGSFMKVMERSYEMLIVCIIASLIHKYNCIQNPLFKEYAIPLDWRNLEAAVIKDERALNALLCVKVYFQISSEGRRGPVFSLDNIDGTLEFSLRYAQTSGEMNTRWDNERKNAASRKVDHEKRVAAKKGLAARLRNELETLREALQEDKIELEHRKRELEGLRYNDGSNTYKNAQRKVSTAYNTISNREDEISSKKKEIEKAIKCPDFIRNPLPSVKDQALVVIYFATLPQDHQILSRVLVVAQKTFSPVIIPAGNSYSDSWKSYYCGIDSSSAFCDFSFILHPRNLVIPKRVGPGTVDELTNDSSCCVWHPNDFQNNLSLKCETNPWAATLAAVRSAFIEVLPSEYKSLQWALSYPSDIIASERSNRVFAEFSQKPTLFSRLDFETFGSLRAYPNQQIRKIINLVLREKRLPLNNLLSATIIQQALYQVGEISTVGKDLLWKSDLYKRDGAACLHSELDAFADLLAPAPKNYQMLDVLAELVSYLSQFDSHDSNLHSNLAKKYARIAEEWARDIRDYIRNDPTLSASALLELKAKECVIHGYSILCLSHLPDLSSDDCSYLCQLIARYHLGKVFVYDSSLKAELDILHPQVQNCMARHVSVIHSKLDPASLSSLFNIFLELRTPLTDTAEWSKSELEPCIDVHTGVHTISFNFLSGCLLLDGMPPGRLPESILTHKNYKKHFGNRDFEVRTVGAVLQTTEKLAGKLYQFYLTGSQLIIWEIDEARRLEFMDFPPEAWWSDLPLRLQQYSHWYSNSEKALVFRSYNVLEKEILYFIHWTPNDVGACFKVKNHLASLSITELLHMKYSFDSFVVPQNLAALKIFSKFEQKEFIHTLSKPDGSLMISLPRFKISFISNSEGMECGEYNGFLLRTNQRLNDSALPLFSQYLILEDNGRNESIQQTIILIPDGCVSFQGNQTKIGLPTGCFDQLKAISYATSPYAPNFLLAKNIGDRLYLAAIFSASGMLMRDLSFGMTGTEFAIQLVRQSWTSRPLSEREFLKLSDVIKYSFRESALGVLCSHLRYSTERLRFLHNKRSETALNLNFSKMAVWASSQYWSETSLNPNPRRKLMDHEVSSAFDGLPKPLPMILQRDRKVSLSEVCVSTDFVAKREVAQLAIISSPMNPRDKGFPLTQSQSQTALDDAINNELKSSWMSHCANPALETLNSIQEISLRSAIDKDILEAEETIQILRTYLQKAFKTVPEFWIPRFTLQLTSNSLPAPTFTDFMSMACDSSLVLQFNPYLTDKSVSAVRNAILLLLEVTVFNARIQRIDKFLRNGNQAKLLKEVFLREWSIYDHPRWLVFEVEGGLQIRPSQYSTAMQLMDNPGAVLQLNMGEGKTRVIMPMIILAKSKERLTRVNVLTQLLHEAGEHLHSTLTASVLGVKILELPFNRQINLSPANIVTIRRAILEMQRGGGFVISAPEHRLSMCLKVKELEMDQQAISKSLSAICYDFEYFELFDESDAILAYKYQLIYAVGAHERLPEGYERWLTIHAVLRILNTSDRVQAHFKSSVFVSQAPNKPAYVFKQIRLAQGLSDSTSKFEFLQTLKTILLEEILASPPHEFRWLNELVENDPNFNLRVVESVLNEKVSADVSLAPYLDVLSPGNISQILMIRGLLSYGLLEHCLSMRYAVNYGIDKKRFKRMAVPFTAVDVPSEAAEYSHADVALVLSTLSYYYIGLTDNQMKEALVMLLSLSKESQKFHYNLWFRQVNKFLKHKDATSINQIAKLDLTNSSQLDLLCNTFRMATETINFWLEKCVYPTDTQLYNKRIMSSSWDLASSANAVGFSGTKDSHLLLPGQMRQIDPSTAVLMGTDGMMLEKLIDTITEFTILPLTNLPHWMELAKYCANTGAYALIDTGCLLAGTTNQSFAEYLRLELEKASSQLAGILYFDIVTKAWTVLELNSGSRVLESQSSILARECFVIFDDARTRGVDKKLDQTALAVVTLGPKLKKDKLMQGAGRMRQLGSGQRLLVVGTEEVTQGIYQQLELSPEASIGAKEILEWTLVNNKADLIQGFTQWTQQGVYFEECNQDPASSIIKDDWRLEALYNANTDAVLLTDWLRLNMDSKFSGETELISKVAARIHAYGQEIEVLASQNEECERELQEEAEEEREVERQLPSQCPALESLWNYDDALQANFTGTLKSVTVYSVDDAVKKLIKLNHLTKVNWNLAPVYGTINFFTTITHMDSQKEYLRPVDAFLYYKITGCILLLSEMEADAILGRLWRNPEPNVVFGHLSQIGKTAEPALRKSLMAGDVSSFAAKAEHSVVLQVFNGETAFTESSENLPVVLRNCLLQMTRTKISRGSLSELVRARGRSSEWEFSQLKSVCDRLM